ncbi:MAG: HAD family phosphatase [Endomicrobiales bacterium]|jgi:beta-phosphoglucomutase
MNPPHTKESLRHALPRKPEAILFDMDGVIVDSMPYHFISWYEALRPYDVSVTCFDVYKREGENWEKALRALWRPSGRPLTPAIAQDILKAKNALFKQYFKRTIFHCVEDILPCLHSQGYKLALVTGTTHKEMLSILPAALRNLFSTIVTGDMVRRGKPFPDPYLAAAKKINLLPKQCVVVENAPYGIRAAKAAGMFCIALTTSLPAEYLVRADIVINTIKDITHIFPGCKRQY